MADTGTRHRLGPRQWVELLLGAAALAVSAISLWVAVGTENANRQMVAAASWPLLQVDTANLAEDGRPTITFSVINAGEGSAKVKTLEIRWRGKTYSGSTPLLRECCGYKPFVGPADLNDTRGSGLTTGGVHNVVVRAGEKHTFLQMPLGTDNVAAWRKLDVARRELKFRACYCSVFDECWISTLMDLEPQKVNRCPVVRTPYIE